MTERPNVESVFAFICEVERQEDLLDWTIGDLRVWEIFRHHFFQYAYRASGALEDSKNVLKRNRVPWLSYFADAFLVIKNTRFFGKRRVGVFPFYRKDANGIDIYCQDFIESLGSRGVVFTTGEDDLRRTDRINTIELNTLFRKLFGSSASAWVRKNVRDEDYRRYEKIVSLIESKFNTQFNGNWKTLPVQRIRDYLVQSRGYSIIFKLFRFSSVLVVSAIQQGIIGGARKAGVAVAELQHGAISSFHPSFNWPVEANPTNVVDYFATWGPGWTSGIQFAPRTKPVVVGAISNFEHIRRDQSNEVQGQVAFISSADITTQLFDIALKCAAANPDLKFIFKGHPREDLTAQVAQLEQQKGLTNLQIMQAEKTGLQLIKESEYVVGVHSAALFEASGLNKKIGIVKISGWEIGRSLVSAGVADLFEPGEIATKIRSIKPGTNSQVFYKDRSAAELTSFLQKL